VNNSQKTHCYRVPLPHSPRFPMKSIITLGNTEKSIREDNESSFYSKLTWTWE
jgi:hypothetical protein